MPAAVRPMLACLAPGPFDSGRHLFEPKWDGLRAVAFVRADEAWLQSRRLRRWTAEFPEVVAALRELGRRACAVLDGELVVVGERGRPDFEAVAARSRMGAAAARRAADRHPASYVAFDLLYLDGEDLRGQPLEERRRRLQAWAGEWAAGAGALAVCPGQRGAGTALFDAACRLGMEGVVAKELSSPYLEGRRSRHWLKIKPYRTASAWVVGFVPSGRNGIRALAVALPREGEPKTRSPGSALAPPLELAGLVGTGLSAAEQRRLRAELDAAVRPAPPARMQRPRRRALPREFARVVWTSPVVRVLVRYLERTGAGWIRHASVLGPAP